ncbi:MAG: 5'/3'-nucleotidase SurE [Anaerolineae bacterium]|nr:5'/3'-nucleotidase SurE [Anaerolineae bacterium]
MSNAQPLLLITNDDGIDSPGLWAAAQAVTGLGEIIVAAPCQQWSGASRCFSSQVSGIVTPRAIEIAGQAVEAFCVDAAPAQVVLHALLELVPRRPDLLIVGINYGENLGADATISGTVGAALQGATAGIPAIAVSLQTPKEMHVNPSNDVDFTAAMHFTHLFARRLLHAALPFDADALKIDVPQDATPSTPWRLARVSRRTYFHAVPPLRDDLSQPSPIDYAPRWELQALERDSDIYALAVERIVSVAPLSVDLTSRADPGQVEALLCGPLDF